MFHPHDDVLRPFLDKLVFVYLDDIVLLNENIEEHKRNLGEVFEVLRHHKLQLKNCKCVFW